MQIINTTPKSSINITPKPLYRIQNNHLAGTAAPPATTYRPQTISFATQRPATSPSPSYAPAHQSTKPQSYASSTRGPIDFDAEFKKFQQTHNYVSPSTPSPHAPQSIKHQGGPVTNNPVYQSQLIFNPSTGQYDSSLYQSIAQTDQEFDLNLRHQPYVQQYQIPQTPPQHLVTYEQAAQNQQFRLPSPPTQSQVPQQIYQKQQNDLQFVNSQQLFAQQLELQQNQLQRDRIEASKKHRFQLPQPQSQALRAQSAPQQQLYFFQPQQGGPHGAGQIDAFLRNHNIEY